MSWEMVKFTDIVQDITGGNQKFQSSEYLPSGKFPIIDQGDTFIGGYSNSNSIVKRNKEVVVFGDHTKALKFVDFDFCLGADGVKVLQPIEGLHPKFLFYYLGTINLPDVGYSRHYKFLKEIQIPLPPLPVQKRIAGILDAADALRRKDHELLKKYDELAQAIFIDMFGDPVKNEKGWERKTINESIEFMTSGSRGWAQYYSENGDLFLRINNVGYNEMKLQDLIFVIAPNNAEAIRTEVKSGDILLSITADLGRTCVIPDNFPKAFINQHLAILRLKKEFEPVFVSQVLSSEFGKLQFKKLNKGGVKAGLNFDDIKSLEFLNPPINYQIKYKKILEEVKKQSDTIILSNKNSENLFQTLLQQAFKGELVAE